MATTPVPSLDIRAQIARIDQKQADIGQKLATTDRSQETRLAPLAIAFTGVGGGAATCAPGAACTTLFVG